MSSIVLAHYIFQLGENRLLDGETEGLADRMKDVELALADLACGIGQPVAVAAQLLMDADGAEIKRVIQDDARERD